MKNFLMLFCVLLGFSQILATPIVRVPIWPPDFQQIATIPSDNARDASPFCMTIAGREYYLTITTNYVGFATLDEMTGSGEQATFVRQISNIPAIGPYDAEIFTTTASDQRVHPVSNDACIPEGHRVWCLIVNAYNSDNGASTLDAYLYEVVNPVEVQLRGVLPALRGARDAELIVNYDVFTIPRFGISEHYNDQTASFKMCSRFARILVDVQGAVTLQFDADDACVDTRGAWEGSYQQVGNNAIYVIAQDRTDDADGPNPYDVTFQVLHLTEQLNGSLTYVLAQENQCYGCRDAFQYDCGGRQGLLLAQWYNGQGGNQGYSFAFDYYNLNPATGTFIASGDTITGMGAYGWSGICFNDQLFVCLANSGGVVPAPQDQPCYLMDMGTGLLQPGQTLGNYVDLRGHAFIMGPDMTWYLFSASNEGGTSPIFWTPPVPTLSSSASQSRTPSFHTFSPRPDASEDDNEFPDYAIGLIVGGGVVFAGAVFFVWRRKRAAYNRIGDN